MENVEQENLRPLENPGKPLATWPDILAYLAYIAFLVLIFDQAVKTDEIDLLLTWGAVGGAVLWGFIGYRHGIVNEVVSLARWVVPVTVAWLAGQQVGALAGYPNFIGTCLGTPLVFMATWYILYLMLGPAYNNPRQPTLPGQFFGLLFGVGEALLLIAAIGGLISFIPAKSLQTKSSVTAELGEILNTRMLKPWLAANASGPIMLLQLVSEKRFQENAHKIDWRAVRDQLGHIARHPKLQPLGENAELHNLLRQKRFAEFLRHPAIKTLVTDPELNSISESIDWQNLHAIMSRSMAVPDLPMPEASDTAGTTAGTIDLPGSAPQ